MRAMRRGAAFFARTLRAVRLAATDKRIPRWLRGLVALGLLPVPGPFDEAVLLVALVPLLLFYRGPLADAWKRADALADGTEVGVEPAEIRDHEHDLR